MNHDIKNICISEISLKYLLKHAKKIIATFKLISETLKKYSLKLMKSATFNQERSSSNSQKLIGQKKIAPTNHFVCSSSFVSSRDPTARRSPPRT